MKQIPRILISYLTGNSYKKEYQEIIKIKSKDDLIKFQENYLEKLILHAYKNVRYYHNIFKEIGIVNNSTVNLSKFNKIPILTKKS